MYFGRGKNKVQNPYNLKDIYSWYILDKKEGTVYHMSFFKYKCIVFDYFKTVMQKIFEGEMFKIPFRLGQVYIIKKQIGLEPRSMTPNWELTNKYGKIIYHLNEHTGGYRYQFKWDKLNCRNRNHKMYRLEFTRANKRQLAKYIKNKVFDYLEEQ